MAKVGAAAATQIKQQARTTITNLLSQYFSSTLNREQDIVNIVMAIIQEESSFNYNAVGPILSTSNSSLARDYWNSQPIKNLVATGTSTQRSLASQGLSAQGMMQSMGLNHIKGASLKNGKTEVEISRPDLVSQLVWPPGTDLSEKMLGQVNIPVQILAGLTLLESKYKHVSQTGQGWHFGSSNQYFNSKIAASIGAYLGVGGYDTRTGITPSQYVAAIMYGSKYKLANGSASNGVVINANAPKTSQGTPVNIASGDNQYPAGC